MRVPKHSTNDSAVERGAKPSVRRADPLDDAVSLSDSPTGSDDDEKDDVLSEDERNATGGALPGSDDEDNDNDNDDARERDIPDHFVRDEDE